MMVDGLPAILPAGLDTVDGAVRPRLLLVDDQALNIQALHRAFAADHQVYMATSGAQALAACISKQPDLVLLDVVMPDMDGYEVCRQLKLHEATRDIPVIFVTAHSDEEAETRGLEAGAVDFISKPINPKIVRARVKTHLTLKRQADLLRRWVYIDGLTGANNRRYFDERLQVEWARSVRQDAPLSVIMIDVDFFKRFNDRHGHQAGDECLRKVAAGLRSVLKRPTDLLARYGGEEFVCLLPDTGLAGAQELAEQLRQRVFELAIEHGDSTVGPCVTVSLGVCATPAPKARGDAAALVKQADAQLYLAKQQGRHRVAGAEMAATSA